MDTKLSACARCSLVVYCSRECQRAHWKASHKQCCFAKADRAPQQRHKDSVGSCEATKSKTGSTEERCCICLEAMTKDISFTLGCKHLLHVECAAELRKFGLKQSCPFCRAPLPPGPEKLAADAMLHIIKVGRLVARGEASWSALSVVVQRR